MCNNKNINLLFKDKDLKMSITDSYLNDKLNDFIYFLNHFNNNLFLLNIILESRFSNSIDNETLSLLSEDLEYEFLPIIKEILDIDLKVDFENILTNFYNILSYSISNSYSFDFDNVVLINDNNYFLFSLNHNDNLSVSLLKDLNSCMVYLDSSNLRIINMDDTLKSINNLLNSN